MTPRNFLIAFVLSLHLFAANSVLAFGSEAEVSLTSEVDHIVPGEPFTIGVVMSHTPGWHSYWINTGGEGGAPTVITPKLPDGFSAKVTLAAPHLFNSQGAIGFGYEGEVVHLVEITPPDDLAEEELDIKIDVALMTCDADSCTLPETLSPSIKLSVSSEPNAPGPGADKIESARSSAPKAGQSLDFTTEKTADSFNVSVKLPEGVSTTAEEVFFFPESRDISSGEQSPEISDGTLTLTLKSASGTLPEELKGVLSLGHGVAYQIGSDETPQPPDPVGPGPKETDPAPLPGVEESAASYTMEEEEAAIERLADRYQMAAVQEGRDEGSLSLKVILGFAFLGGMILNLMPCVFPVLGIKVLGFVQQSGSDKTKIRNHGLVFAAGVIISMWVLVAVLLVVKAAVAKEDGTVVWGFQLQNPAFVAFMIAVLFLFALNLAGLFEFGTSLTTVGGDLQQKKGYTGSFFSGVLTVLVATPCTGPFLGPAFAFALSQSSINAVLVFTFVALGVSAPYVILSFLPKLIQKLPKPGAWMVTFKQVMSFLLFATCIWLILVFTRSTGAKGVTWLLSGLLAGAFGCWLYGKYVNAITPPTKKYICSGLALASLVMLGYAGYRGSLEEGPETNIGMRFSPSLAESLNKKGRTVWIDFTADW